MLPADFDRDVVASQPFGITGALNGRARRHVPDYMLRLPAGAVGVDVKPAALIDKPKVAKVLSRTDRLMAQFGDHCERND